MVASSQPPPRGTGSCPGQGCQNEWILRCFFVSLPALQTFASSVASDPQLRQKLDAASGLDDVVAIAQAHGHAFSKATLLRAHAKAVADAPDHRLEALNSWGDALMHCFGASAND